MLRVAAIFKDGMVLQRNSTNRIWGQSDADYVELSVEGNVTRTKVSQGKWSIDLEVGMSDTPLVIHIRNQKENLGETGESLEIKDVLLGEVWLAGGQSNMELELKDSKDGRQVALQAAYDKIRFYNVPKCPVVDEELAQCERTSCWKRAVGAECLDMSAVAFYFAATLYEELQVPIGIIDCYWGGTSATCWVSPDALKNVTEVKDYLDSWEEVYRTKSDEQYWAEMAECQREFEETGVWPWPQPRGRLSPFRPYGLYESMIKRVAPYGIRGVIYYQGEEDYSRSSFYRKLNSAVIRQWREDFSTQAGSGDEICFLLTQLPMYRENGVGDDGNWAVLRRQQELCALENKNAGMAVLVDCGEFGNIHPVNKRTPGMRLALQALDLAYHVRRNCCNMIVTQVSFEGNCCRLTLENTYGAICYQETHGIELTAEKESTLQPAAPDGNGQIYGFEISDSGTDFYRPRVSVSGDKIVLTGYDNSKVSHVRYGWFNYGVANLYNASGMPLVPFYYRKSGDSESREGEFVNVL